MTVRESYVEITGGLDNWVRRIAKMKAWLEQVQGRMEGKETGDKKYRELFQEAIAERDVGF